MHSRHEVVAVVTVPDRQAGRGQRVTVSAVGQYAMQHGLPLLQPEKLRNEGFLQALHSFEADCFVVVAFRMLPEAVWGMPRLGTFNLHASLLPRYRGAAPINWAIINGEHTTGVTTFLLNHAIDEGNILLQKSTEILAGETASSLHDRLAAMGRELVVQTLDGLESGTIVPHPQTGEACPAPKIFKETTRIDFTRSAEEVCRFVRGLSPYPAATMTLCSPDGREVGFKVFEARVVHRSDQSSQTLVTDGKNWLNIAANDYFVSIYELQMAGKKRMSIKDFLRGTRVDGWKLV